MNKDVIYIEPEYDITDIISKIKTAKNKIIALVPPKKAGVLRSAVNFKLLQKAALQNEKTIVLITSDATLIKFAAGVKMPVAKSLQSKPRLPELEVEEEDEDEDGDLIEEKDGVEAEAPVSADDKKDSKHGADANSDDEEKPASRKAKTSNSKSTAKKSLDLKRYQKPLIFGAIGVVALVAICFWAFAIAPAVKLTVSVKASEKNFSKNVQLTTDASKEDLEKSILLAEKKTVKIAAAKSDGTNDFTATGEIDKGDKASGTITVALNSPITIPLFNANPSVPQIQIPVGTKFKLGELEYVATKAVKLGGMSTDGYIDISKCELGNMNLKCNLLKDVSAQVELSAAQSGEKYNAGANNSAWTSTISGVHVSAGGAMSGGTSNVIKIVTEDDIANAEELLVSKEEDAKRDFDDKYGKDYVVIASSFKTDLGKVSTSPALDEEVGSDTQPKILREDSFSVVVVERKTIDEFIRAKLKEELGDDTQDVYFTGALESRIEDKNKKGEEKVIEARAFFEAFKEENGKMTARLKSVTKTGPRVTPEMIAEKIMGKKTGEVRTMLASINGVSDIKIDKSCPWVTSIPKDINKVEIKVVVE